eukprot:CAMPEP_0197857314 /NCGR_PEP_ID=MMETSP1438-20131217/30227_1 /TAXON_ID=1461541 /ORGANISM="Pterosperma sp., Strain CCMP1384" /LENGTH=90 /DNA_ID=CAMNT_0043473099 /DNA_START=181 /DNA_END=453 /DNA_ORIENTATION=+
MVHPSLLLVNRVADSSSAPCCARGDLPEEETGDAPLTPPGDIGDELTACGCFFDVELFRGGRSMFTLPRECHRCVAEDTPTDVPADVRTT